MFVTVSNLLIFKNDIYEYIINTYNILPHYVSVSALVSEVKPICFDFETNKFSILSNCKLNTISRQDSIINFHTRPEIIALNYINKSIHSSDNVKLHLIKTLKHWLPSCTINSVTCKFKKCIFLSDLEPSWAYSFLNVPTKFTTLTYKFVCNQSPLLYYNSEVLEYSRDSYTIQNCEKILNIEIIENGC